MRENDLNINKEMVKNEECLAECSEIIQVTSEGMDSSHKILLVVHLTALSYNMHSNVRTVMVLNKEPKRSTGNGAQLHIK